MPPISIEPLTLFAVPTVLALVTLAMTFIGLKSGQGITILQNTMQLRIQSFEREIDQNRQEILLLKQKHEQCIDRLQALSAENLDLMRRLVNRSFTG